MLKSNTEIADWFKKLSPDEKVKVVRDGYNSQGIEKCINLLEEKLLSVNEEEEEEKPEDKKEIMKNILANYTKLGASTENGAVYISSETYKGIIYIQPKIQDIMEVVKDQINLGRDYDPISFFINIYENTKLEHILIRSREVIYFEISSVSFLRPCIKIVTDILKHEETRKELNGKLNRFKITYDDVLKCSRTMTNIIEDIEYEKKTSPPPPPLLSSPLLLPLEQEQQEQEEKEHVQPLPLPLILPVVQKRKYTRKA